MGTGIAPDTDYINMIIIYIMLLNYFFFFSSDFCVTALKYVLCVISMQPNL